MLETNVRQLPQQVVQPHDRSVVPCRAGDDGIDPQDVIGRTGRRALAGADPHRRQPPRRRAQQQRRRRLRGRVTDHHDDIATSGNRAQRADRVDSIDRESRKGALADDDRMHELDGDVPGVLGPQRGDTPHRRPGGEATGEIERTSGEVVGEVFVVRHQAGRR